MPAGGDLNSLARVWLHTGINQDTNQIFHHSKLWAPGLHSQKLMYSIRLLDMYKSFILNVVQLRVRQSSRIAQSVATEWSRLLFCLCLTSTSSISLLASEKQTSIYYNLEQHNFPKRFHSVVGAQQDVSAPLHSHEDEGTERVSQIH